MLIILALAMIGAFITGAFVRKPFLIPKKQKVVADLKNTEQSVPTKNDQLINLYEYTGEKQEGIFDEY